MEREQPAQPGLPSVSWRQKCQQKSEVGLGVLNLRDMNKALLSKWWWILMPKMTLLVTYIYQRKYGSRSLIWNARRRNSFNISGFFGEEYTRLGGPSSLVPPLPLGTVLRLTFGRTNGAARLHFDTCSPPCSP